MITRIVMAPRRAGLDAAEFAHEVYLAFDLTNQLRGVERVISRVRTIVR